MHWIVHYRDDLFNNKTKCCNRKQNRCAECFFFFIKIESLHSDDSKVKQLAYEYCARYFKSALRTEVMECKQFVYNNRFSSSMFKSPDDHKYALEERHSAGPFLGQ